MPASELILLLHQALEPRLARMQELGRIQGWQQDPELLHQVRVASRRVRAVLDLADPAVYPGLHRHEHRMRRLARDLGAARELDVHLELLEAMKTMEPDPVRTAMIEHAQEILDRRRRRRRRPLLRRLESEDIGGFFGLLDHPALPTVVNASGQAAGAWHCLEPRVRRLQDDLPGLLVREEAEALHRFRIQIKRMRYALEILEPAFPSSVEPWMQSLRAIQVVLGEHHDLATLEAVLWEEQTRLAGRGRRVLAGAALDLLALAAEERRVRYERFRDLGGELIRAMPYFHLRQMLMPGSPA